MMKNNPSILALDFDGVICDGLIEYFEVAWRTYCQVWSSANETPLDDLASKFYQLRPVIETGWEMPVLIKALVVGIAEAEILQEWHNINQQILLSDNLNSKEISTKLDKLRDEWIAKDLASWLNLHRFYPGVIDKLKATINSTNNSTNELYIISTKEGRFVQQLLQQEGVNFGSDKIFGKEVKRPKYEILRELIQLHQVAEETVWFVEDRLKTLQLVDQQTDLKEVKLFLADWGYNTPSEKITAQNDPRIQLLSLSHFGQDFSEWLLTND